MCGTLYASQEAGMQSSKKYTVILETTEGMFVVTSYMSVFFYTNIFKQESSEVQSLQLYEKRSVLYGLFS